MQHAESEHSIRYALDLLVKLLAYVEEGQGEAPTADEIDQGISELMWVLANEV